MSRMVRSLGVVKGVLSVLVSFSFEGDEGWVPGVYGPSSQIGRSFWHVLGVGWVV